jgi:LPS export ABC transporter protein LptC
MRRVEIVSSGPGPSGRGLAAEIGKDMDGTIAPRGKTGARRRRSWQWFLGLFLLLGLTSSLVIWARRPAPAPPAPAATAPAEARAKMETLSLTEIHEGDKRWVLDAEKADFLSSRMEIRLTGVRAEFFGPHEEPIKVKCREGLINTKTRVLTMKGQVELESKDMKVVTELAIYQPSDRVLLAPEDVTLEGPRVRVQGKGLRVELAGRRLVLAQHRLTELKAEGWETHQ